MVKILPILILFCGLYSCGKSTEFSLEKINIKLIQNTDNSNTTCDYYFESDSLIEETQKGIVINFDLKYSPNSGSQKPGNKGTKDTIVKMLVSIDNKNTKFNITKTLRNSSSNKINTFRYNSNFINIQEFINCYNNLQISKKANLSYNYFEKLETGFDLDGANYIYWIPDSISNQLSKQDTLKVILELSDKRILTDYKILK